MPNQTSHPAKATVLVSRGANVLPAAPTDELYRSAARFGRIDRRAQRHCGIDSFPVIMTTAAQSTTIRELPQMLVL
jgi:hypothetical protein